MGHGQSRLSKGTVRDAPEERLGDINRGGTSTSTWPLALPVIIGPLPQSSTRSMPRRDKELHTHGYSTDPRDLPPGHTIGSMTVPFTLPIAAHCQKCILDTHEHKGQKRQLMAQSNSTLCNPKNVEELIKVLGSGHGVNVNAQDEMTGNAPIHAIVMERKRKDKPDLLLALLVYSKADINLPVNNWKRMTALQLAIEEDEVMCIKVLLAFGANVNLERQDGCTALDLVKKKSTVPDSVNEMLIQMGAMTGNQLHKMKENQSNSCSITVPFLHSYAENMKPPAQAHAHSALSEKMQLYLELEEEVKRRISFSASYDNESSDDSHALVLQQRELYHFNRTLQESGIGLFGGAKGGSRILSLDGGGIRGLVQLEILMQLEEATGRKVTDLFDWIIGTSTGGVIALALVYGKKSLREIFQLYFRMKDRIFSKPRIGYGFNTDVLEEILQEYLDPDIRMTDVTHPKVLISAVSKATTNLSLHFFNNCFGDYMDYPVWKVARYTSATPLFFSECDNYVDGGVICNNPTEFGLTRIQNFFRQQGKKLSIALVVSIGTGIYPDKELGSIDLFLGIQTLTHIKQRAQNLISLLETALNQSEKVAKNSQSRCEEQDIPFYRFSPELNETIAGSETNNEKLFNMVIQTRLSTKKQGMEELVQLFHTVANASQHLDFT